MNIVSAEKIIVHKIINDNGIESRVNISKDHVVINSYIDGKMINKEFSKYVSLIDVVEYINKLGEIKKDCDKIKQILKFMSEIKK